MGMEEIFKQAHTIAAPWKVQSTISFEKDGNRMTLDPVNGLVVRDVNDRIVWKLGMDGSLYSSALENQEFTAQQMEGLARAQHGGFRDTFENVTDFITPAQNGVQTYVQEAGEAGGVIYRSTGYVWCVYPILLPYSPDQNYRFKARVRRTAGGTGGTISVGVIGVGADRTTRVDFEGADTNKPYFVCCKDASPTSATWTEYTGWFKGTSGTSSQSPSDDPQDPHPLHTGVKYIRPCFVLNSTAGTEVQEIDELKIEIVDDVSPDVITVSELNAATITGGTIDGATITGGAIQTNQSATIGVKINDNGLYLYDTSNTLRFWLCAADGTVKIYDASGTPTFTIGSTTLSEIELQALKDLL